MLEHIHEQQHLEGLANRSVQFEGRPSELQERSDRRRRRRGNSQVGAKAFDTELPKMLNDDPRAAPNVQYLVVGAQQGAHLADQNAVASLMPVMVLDPGRIRVGKLLVGKCGSCLGHGEVLSFSALTSSATM